MAPKQRILNSEKRKKDAERKAGRIKNRVDIKFAREYEEVPGTPISFPRQVLKISVGESEFCINIADIRNRLREFVDKNKDVSAGKAVEIIAEEISEQIQEAKDDLKKSGIIEMIKDIVFGFLVKFFEERGINMLARLVRVVEAIMAALINGGRRLLGYA